MTLSELIETLQLMADDHGKDCEVRLAHQPNYPFELSIASVIAFDDEDADLAAVIYIAEGQQLGYLPGAAARELGWGRR